MLKRTVRHASTTAFRIRIYLELNSYKLIVANCKQCTNKSIDRTTTKSVLLFDFVMQNIVIAIMTKKFVKMPLIEVYFSKKSCYWVGCTWN